MANRYNEIPQSERDRRWSRTNRPIELLSLPLLEREPASAASYALDRQDTEYVDTPTEKNIWTPTKLRKPRPPRQSMTWPFAELAVQFIILAGMISFVVWSSTGQRIVPQVMAYYYINHPQTTATTLTLVGTLLSMINTKLFVNAIRFAIKVLLGETGTSGISLYSLYAASSVCSRSFLFGLDEGRVRWTIASLFCFSLFAAQTSAWTTILTPRPTLISYLDSFSDIDITAPFANGNNFYAVWEQTSASGAAAAREVFSDVPQFLLYSNSVLNGTSHGILPNPNISYHAGDWDHMEAIQQGFSVDVNCKSTSNSDRALRSTQNTTRTFGEVFSEVTVCCNCTSFEADKKDLSIFILGTPSMTNYAALTLCPADANKDFTTLYIQGSAYSLQNVNVTCTVRPQVLSVNVTYSNDGFVTLEPTVNPSASLDLNAWLFKNASAMLSYHFYCAQNMASNVILDIFNEIYTEYNSTHPSQSVKSDQRVINDLMANYIRGVFEHAATVMRQMAISDKTSTKRSVRLITYAQVIVWGQAPQLKLIILISPLAIMITTLSVILISMYRARNLSLDHAACFDPMNTLHIIAACSSGNVQTVVFPDYDDNVEAFSKDIKVRLAEERPRGGGGRPFDAAGFYIYRRNQLR